MCHNHPHRAQQHMPSLLILIIAILAIVWLIRHL